MTRPPDQALSPDARNFGMDLGEVRVFLAVSRELHFGRAAQELGVSASRVSEQVRRLERRLGTTLFERTSRQVRLTAHGRHLLREAGPAYAAIERALAHLRTSTRAGAGTVRVGFDVTLPADLSRRLIHRFEQRYPGSRVIQSGHPAADLRGWIGGRWPVDVFVAWMPPDGDTGPTISKLEYGPVIARVPRVLAVADDHPLAAVRQIDYEQLADHEVLYIADGLSEQYSQAWTPPRTPSGRKIPLHTMVGPAYLEEVMRVVIERRTAHVTIASVPTRQHFPGIAFIPLIGIPPMPIRPVWPTVNPHPLAPAFARTCADPS